MTEWLVPMAAMALVMSITPGPNNVLLTASGARVGLVRTLPALLGVLVGFLVLIVLCEVGVGAVVAGFPQVHVVLMLVASAYMIWLAWALWRATVAHGEAGTPSELPWWRFTVLQFVNPKTWLATLALVSGYLQGRSLDLAQTTAAVALFLAIVTMSMTVWTVFGASIRARTGPEQWRVVNRSLAVLAACTVVTFWL